MHTDRDSAIEAWAFMHGLCHDVRIYEVAEDGTESPLPTYEEALDEIAKRPPTPVVIEDVDDAGTQWLLSFDGPNPTEDMCVRCVDRAEALKLKHLIETIGAVDTIAVMGVRPAPEIARLRQASEQGAGWPDCGADVEKRRG